MAHFVAPGAKPCRKNHSFSFLLALIVVTTLLGLFAVSTLDSEARISLTRGVYLFFVGLIFFNASFYFINNVALRTSLGIKYKKKYHLNVMDVFDISNKIVSSVQALLSCLTGLIICTYSCTRSLLKTSHFVSEAYAWFGASYFFYDIWSMYKVHTCGPADQKNGTIAKEKNKNALLKFGEYIISQPIIIMHHIFIGSFGFLVIVYLRGGLGDCVFGYVYLMELSTPFVSLRGILSKMGLKQSKLYVINGLLMLATFFFCRVAMFPYVCYLYSLVVDKPYFEAIMLLPRGCKIGIMILLLPQLYWFWLMIKGALKVFCPLAMLQPSSGSNSNIPKRQRRAANNSNSSTSQNNHNS